MNVFTKLQSYRGVCDPKPDLIITGVLLWLVDALVSLSRNNWHDSARDTKITRVTLNIKERHWKLASYFKTWACRNVLPGVKRKQKYYTN